MVCLAAMPVDGVAWKGAEPPVFDVVTARAEHLSPGEPRVLSKKEEWLRDKELRPDFHTSDNDLQRAQSPDHTASFLRAARLLARGIPGPDPTLRPGARIEPLTTLYNVWTHEALPILPGATNRLQFQFHRFLRDHYTNQATRMDDAPHRRAGARGRQVLRAAHRGRLWVPVAQVQPDAAQEGPSGRAQQPAHGRARRRLPHPRRRRPPRCCTTSAPCAWAASASTPTPSSSTATPAPSATGRAASARALPARRADPDQLVQRAGGEAGRGRGRRR